MTTFIIDDWVFEILAMLIALTIGYVLGVYRVIV